MLHCTTKSNQINKQRRREMVSFLYRVSLRGHPIQAIIGSSPRRARPRNKKWPDEPPSNATRGLAERCSGRRTLQNSALEIKLSQLHYCTTTGNVKRAHVEGASNASDHRGSLSQEGSRPQNQKRPDAPPRNATADPASTTLIARERMYFCTTH